MFEKTLSDKFKKIFGVKDISYSQPGESKEQECLFIEIDNSWNNIRDGRAIAKVTGSAFLIGNADKLPFGFFSKRIKQAGDTEPELVSDLFFYDLESNVKTFGNIIQRGFSFVYFFNAQYDPEVGSITEIDIVEEQDS